MLFQPGIDILNAYFGFKPGEATAKVGAAGMEAVPG